MEVNNRTAIAILRLVNAAAIFKNLIDRERYIREKLKDLNDEQLIALDKALKSMILLTSGNVEAVRNPKIFDPDMTEPWSHIASPSAKNVLSQIPGYVPGSEPTRKDYETAKRLLPVLGSSFMDFDEIQSLTGGTEPEDYRDLDLMKGFGKLYRGLQNMSLSSIKFLTTYPKWDMERGVSTSYKYSEAEGFASIVGNGTNAGPSIMFHIDNPKKKGFIADRVSNYDTEAEVILSGMLDVKEWNIVCKAKCRFEIGTLGVDGVSDVEIKKVSGDNILSIVIPSLSKMEVKLDDDQMSTLLSGESIYVENLFDDDTKKKLRVTQAKRLSVVLKVKNLLMNINATVS
jgi:hypothetical protein